MSWGGKSSPVKWKLYNKSLEVWQWVDTAVGKKRVSSKPWITAQWRSVGMNVLDVWRLEVSITDAALFEYKGRGLSLARFEDADFAHGLFQSLYTHRFVQRRNEGHACRKNDTQVWLLSAKDLQRCKRRMSAKAAEPTAGVSVCRALCKQMLDSGVQANLDALGYLGECLLRQVEVYRLQDWFVANFECEPADWVANVCDNGGSGLHDVDLTDVVRKLGE